MKRLLLASAALLLGLNVASAQTGPVGQQGPAGSAINQQNFDANTDYQGFAESSLTPSLVVPGTATTQALGTLITSRVTVLTTCSGTTGVVLPSVYRYMAITIINRSGGSCLVWPSSGATVETALGTAGATNAPATVLTNTDTTFRPITAVRWVQ